jgi:hypothetical protein
MSDNDGQMTKPSVGRIVHFCPGRDQKITTHERQPLAAIIAHVWGDDCVNLCVFDGQGRAHNCTQVPLLQPGKPPPAGGYCCWWPQSDVGRVAMANAQAAKESAAAPQTPPEPRNPPPENTVVREGSEGKAVRR